MQDQLTLDAQSHLLHHGAFATLKVDDSAVALRSQQDQFREDVHSIYSTINAFAVLKVIGNAVALGSKVLDWLTVDVHSICSTNFCTMEFQG